MRATLQIIGCLILVGVARADEPNALPPLNQKVLQYAKDKLGKQVANGECWYLAKQALAAAGARLPGLNGVGAYEFGRRLKADEKPLPGDVVQFEGVKLERKDGAVLEIPFHTAIVVKVDGGSFVLLNQNAGGVRKVTETDLSGFELKNGEILVFRPIPAKPDVKLPD